MKPQVIFKGDALIFGAMFIFGAYALFLRFFPDILVLSFLFFFQLIGALTFFVVLTKQGFPRLSKRLILLLAALAFIAIANDLSYFLAFRLTKVANAALAHQMDFLFLLLLAPILLKEKTKKEEWIALPFAIFGIVMLYGNSLTVHEWKDFLGITLGLLSSIFLALLIILYRYLPNQGLSISAINFWRYSFSVALLLPAMFVFDGFNFTLDDLVPLISFGFIFAFLASGIHNSGISLTRSLHVSIISKSEPIIASFYALVFLRETPTIWTLFGGLLIVGSSFWLIWRHKNS